MLTPADVGALASHELAMGELSGRAEHHHGPFPAGSHLAPDFVDTTRERMGTPIDAIGWRRYWGAFDGSDLVGVAYAAGGQIAAESHRCHLGVSVLPAYRRRGFARQLLRAVIGWCRSEPAIAWLDLGVFGHNSAAAALYREEGFSEIGRTPDRFRVDGVRIDDISMTLSVE